MSYTDKLKWSKEIADRIIKDYNPFAILVAYTSGADSNVALKVATLFMPVSAAFTCDTTISAIETLRNCERVASDVYGLKYITKFPPYAGLKENPNTYAEIVKRHGFPGSTDTAHAWMYRWLKDHTVSRIISSIRARRHNRPIVIVSGARRHESKRRWGTSEDITIQGNNIWLNIINDWTDQDCYEFTRDNDLDRYRSPISHAIGLSGDCFCGSFAQPGDLLELKIASPTTHEKIIGLQQWVLDNTTMQWTWEEGPSKYQIKEKHGQLNLFTPNMLLCSTCINNH